MKHLFFILTFICWGCNAQTVKPYFNNTGYGKESNVYYKDIDNDFGKYVGTWIYTNGTTSFKIVLIKKEMVSRNIGNLSFSIDYLIGEYQYIENGTEIVNTLNSISEEYDNPFDYNLVSAGIVENSTKPKCTTCSANERRISMVFNEPTRRNVVGLTSGLMLRKVTENGVEKIKAIFYGRGGALGFTMPEQTPTTIDSYSLPYGEYTLTKIN